ncbi:MAG TPA: SRPBCC family protein [Phnomibacter sp.]|nr:SRPBCC family protein [Phnomibacter sp.]
MPPAQALPKQIGREYISTDEDAIAAAMVNELEKQLDRLYKNTKTLRQVHTKMHGCVKAAFTIEPHLPAALRVGVFAEEKAYHAWVRFSNGSTVPKPDVKKDVRGIAIKLMGVPGEKLLTDEHLQLTQDFLLMNSETFFSKNVKEFKGLLAAATAASKLKLLGYAVNPLHWSLLKRVAASNKRCSNPLAIAYWSTQPYQFGQTDSAVKYFLKPRCTNAIVVENEREEDYLRINLAQTLNDHEAVFDFFVQFQTDADAMPIEDSTVAWGSQYIKLATLRIPPQEFDSKEQMDFGDNLSFNSWHCLPAHRPLGSFNRVRRRVYEVLSAYRHQKNQLPVFEPQDETNFLPPFKAETGAIDFAVPKKHIVKVQASQLVHCSKEIAFKYISSSQKLQGWLKKSGPVASIKQVVALTSAYDYVGAKRKIIFDNDAVVQEELISFHPYANYAYRVSKFNDFLKKITDAAYGQIWIDRVADTTRITWVYSYSYKNLLGRIFLWFFLQLAFKKYMQNGLRNAANAIEGQND